MNLLIASFHSLASWADPPDINLELSHAWCESLWDVLDHDNAIDSQAFASALWCLGKLGLRPSNAELPSRILHAAVTNTEVPFQDFSEEQLSMLIYGVARIRENDSRQRTESRAVETIRQALEIWMDATMARLSKFCPRSSSNILYCLSKMKDQVHPPERLQGWIDRWIAEAGLRNLYQMDPQGLVMVIYSLAQVRAEIPPEFLKSWYAAFDRKLVRLDTRSISLALHCLASLRRRPPPGMIRRSFQALVSLRRNRQAVTAQSLVLEMDALSRFGMELDPAYLQTWFSGAEQALARDEFTCQGLSLTAFALARLRFRLPPTFANLYLVALDRHINAATPKCAVQLFWALGSLSELGLRPSASLQYRLHQSVLHHLPRISPAGLITLARTLAWFRPVDPENPVWIRIEQSCQATITYNPGNVASTHAVAEITQLLTSLGQQR